MATIEVNQNPAMTRYLVEKTDAFRDAPVTIVDVGARWGFNSEWKVFGRHLRVICFEPDADECRRLNAEASANVRYFPYALGRAGGRATLYETKLAASTGLYKTNMAYFSRLLNRDNGVTAAEREINLVTLNEALRKNDIEYVDFIKLDTEGAELDVLLGGQDYLEQHSLIGILSEIRFQEEINGCPIFWELDRHLRTFGFRLYDLQFHHQSRHILPYPGLQDYRTAGGKRIFAYTTHGQIQDGDALYFRDLLIPANDKIRKSISTSALLKWAAFYEIYCLNDCAAELVVAHREQLGESVDCQELLNLLTPSIRDEKLDYDSYISRYFAPSKGVFANSFQTAAGTAVTQDSTVAQAELNMVYASLSWRITRPLRTLKRTIGKWLA